MKLAQSLDGAVDDLALRSLLELEDNGIGKTRVRAIVQTAWDRETRFSEALAYLEANPDAYASNGLAVVLAAVEGIRTRAAELAQAPDEEFAAWITRMVEALGLRGEALGAVTEAAPYVEDALAEMGATGSSGISFVQELTAALAEIADSRPPRVEGKVTVTTMHGSKGLSADIVFALHAEDEVMPNGLKGIEHDESRRLLYVSLSRARKHLYINICNVRDRFEFVNGQRVPITRTLTRFLQDYGLVGIAADDVRYVANASHEGPPNA